MQNSRRDGRVTQADEVNEYKIHFFHRRSRASTHPIAATDAKDLVFFSKKTEISEF
jgi:hypothetical protein